MTARRILEGIRVLDITQLVAGPYCSRTLADLGADVIKLDPPARFGVAQVPRRAAGFFSQNLGKRSIVLDLKQPSGLAAAKSLAEQSDVLVENYLPGVMARLGMGYDELSERNRGLIYVSISGFGQDTSFSHRRAFGATAHAEAGLLWVQQQAQGGPEPFAPGFTVADIAAGMNASTAVLAALYDRERTGCGQRIDISLMDSQLAMLSEVAGDARANAAENDWKPFRHGLQRAKDGYLAVNVGAPHNWARIAAAFGQSEQPLPKGQAEAEALLALWIAEQTVDEAALIFESAGAPYGVVKSMPEAVRHPYFAERGMFVDLDDPLDGRVTVVDTPFRFSNATSGPVSSAPLAGQHTREVLAALGYDDATIDSLLASGAAVQSGT